MIVNSETTMLQIHCGKVSKAAKLLHEYLCANGRSLCCIADLTVSKGAKIIGKKGEPLISALNLISDK